ncbi:GGDEF domain-containing protein [Pelomonas sp. V22]|uniref:GGDEF domain-containing protein n=1 Tax=Pelomonas sp. V22 TaxID=2822139 RepID=UPI0024A872F9|nr:GGDEF domain-containing protein [Pelomonas sp. V22]MDI4634673.1 GGDEF domain-containing protein [Pelomonas sp. V22]
MASAFTAAAPASAAELRQQLEATPAKDRARAIAMARQALAGPLEPDQRAWFLDRLAADQLRLRRWDEALSSAQQGLALTQVGTPLRVRFASLLAKGRLGLGQPAEALRIHDEQSAPAIPALLSSADRITRLRALEALRVRAMSLLGLARKGEAMEQLTEVLRQYDQLDDAEGQAETLHVMASLRHGSGDVAEALRAEQQAIDIAERGQVPDVLARLHSLMAYLQAQAGNQQAHERELEAARKSAVEEGDDFVQSMVMFNLSDGAMQRKDWAEALRLTDAARPIFLRIGDLNMADLCLANRGIALNRTGHPEGIALLRRANETIASRPGQEVTLVAIQKAIAEELAHNRDFEAAYAAQLEYQRRKEALHQSDNQKRIAEASAAYEADRKQRQIETLEHEQDQQKRFRWLWVLTGVLGLAVAAVIAVSRVYLKRAYRAMHDMALEDPLTGLHNRRYLSSRIVEELAQMRRQRHQALAPRGDGSAVPAEPGAAFLLIDLDHFKFINDEHGHAAGDAVLRQASALLRSLVRQSDTVVRWGGEEFLVFARVAARNEPGELAERICSQMAAHEFDLGQGRRLRRSCSIGFACYPFAPQQAGAPELPSWETVVSLADQCLYAAKASGRALWVGIQQIDLGQPLPEQADAAAGVAQGQFALLHSAGREVSWPAREPGHPGQGQRH